MLSQEILSPATHFAFALSGLICTLASQGKKAAQPALELAAGEMDPQDARQLVEAIDEILDDPNKIEFLKALSRLLKACHGFKPNDGNDK